MAGNAYTPITSQTVASTTTTINFTSIPQTYTDLVLVISGKRNTSSNYIVMQFNGDTASNYSHVFTYGDGANYGTTRGGTSSIYLDLYANMTQYTRSIRHVNIMNYTNATNYKVVCSQAGLGNVSRDTIFGTWRSNSAITSLSVFDPGGGQFQVGSIFTLFGIKAA